MLNGTPHYLIITLVCVIYLFKLLLEQDDIVRYKMNKPPG
jgi:hypothetical protein